MQHQLHFYKLHSPLSALSSLQCAAPCFIPGQLPSHSPVSLPTLNLKLGTHTLPLEVEGSKLSELAQSSRLQDDRRSILCFKVVGS